MKNLKKDLGAVVKALKALTKRTEKLTKAVARLEKVQAPRKPKAKKKTAAKKTVARKTSKKVPAKKKATAKKGVKKTSPKKKRAVTATNRVLKMIKGSKKGTDVPTLIKKTGFHEKKVRNIVARAFKQKKIKRIGRGVYVAA